MVHQRPISRPGSFTAPAEPFSGPAMEVPGSSSDIMRDIKALNSSILLISQKIQFLVRNEKILGRNLLVLNKKIRDVQGGGIPISGTEGISGASQNVQTGLEELRGELKGLKIMLQSINPTQLVTKEELDELVEKKVRQLLKKK